MKNGSHEKNPYDDLKASLTVYLTQKKLIHIVKHQLGWFSWNFPKNGEKTDHNDLITKSSNHA